MEPVFNRLRDELSRSKPWQPVEEFRGLGVPPEFFLKKSLGCKPRPQKSTGCQQGPVPVENRHQGRGGPPWQGTGTPANLAAPPTNNLWETRPGSFMEFSYNARDPAPAGP